jgi:hypothetical protein
MTRPQDEKSARKVSAGSADDAGAYEETAFGRRRVGWAPRWLIGLAGLLIVPLVYLYRRIRPRKPEK